MTQAEKDGYKKHILKNYYKIRNMSK